MHQSLLRLTCILTAITLPCIAMGKTVGGSLHVEGKPAEATGGMVPAGARGVIMLSASLTADCKTPSVVRAITLVDDGTGTVQDIKSIYATIDGARVSKPVNIDSSNRTATIHLNEKLTIQKCATLQIDIAADTSPFAKGSSHSLFIEFGTDIQQDGSTVTGEFPIKGQEFTIAKTENVQCSAAFQATLSKRAKAVNRRTCRKLERK